MFYIGIEQHKRDSYLATVAWSVGSRGQLTSFHSEGLHGSCSECCHRGSTR